MSKEHPILFSAPMVRAILAGNKTQTRRVVAGADAWHPDVRSVSILGLGSDGCCAMPCDEFGRMLGGAMRCPYGQPGNKLWVRETFYAYGRWVTRFNAKKGRDEWHFIDLTLERGKSYLYPASDSQPQPMGGKRHKGGVTPTWWKRPAIFMPAIASRITLDVTGVRVERLQDISEADAIAEGVNRFPGFCLDDDAAAFNRIGPVDNDSFPIARYAVLWEQINGLGGWDANPWVWVVEFKRAPDGRG